MASISCNKKNGHKTVQFYGNDGKRRSIRLGKVPKSVANDVKTRVEQIIAYSITGTPYDAELARWLTTIEDPLAEKLAAVGLIPKREATNLGTFLDEYIASQVDVKLSTTSKMHTHAKRLLTFFGTDRDIRRILPGHCDEFAAWLRSKYAPVTASRSIKEARTFFRRAVRKKLILENPFADLKPGTDRNPSRWFFVDRDTAAKVLDACPSLDDKLVFTLARFGGLRCPSEIQLLTWNDVLWDKNKIRVTSPKTERIAGKGERFIPMFPEVKQLLEEAFHQTGRDTVFVVKQHNHPDQIYRKRFTNILKQAGVVQWEKLFQNLRSSRQTELAATYPSHVVCAWMGNSEDVAMRHYLQVRDEDYDHANTGGAKSGALSQNLVQNPVLQGMVSIGTELTQVIIPEAVCQSSTLQDMQVYKRPVALVGLEPTRP